MRQLVIIARRKPARRAGWAIAGIVGLAGVVAYGVALWRAPGWMHAPTPQDRYNARVLVISVGGAIVVLVGLLYTARNYRLSRRGQVTDRFTVALERLGSTELYVRIGGVHALEHVMRDSAEHYNDVIEVLTAFIRDRTPRRGRQVWHPVTGSVPDPDLPPEPMPDVKAALTALGNRPDRPERQRIDLAGRHLVGAQLNGANLTWANLDGADLTRAYLDGADLTRAYLGGADLTDAHLISADLTRAYLGGTNLADALLGFADDGADDVDAAVIPIPTYRAGGVRVSGRYRTNLTGADLSGATWTTRWPAPEGWERDADGLRLQRSSSGQGDRN
jgi:hypothetical protein